MTELRNKLVQCEICHLYATMDQMEACDNGYICKDVDECCNTLQTNQPFDEVHGG